MSRNDDYRDLLELWAEWWDGPGREQYHGSVPPPLARTREALICLICAGAYADGRCAVCGRDMGHP